MVDLERRETRLKEALARGRRRIRFRADRLPAGAESADRERARRGARGPDPHAMRVLRAGRTERSRRHRQESARASQSRARRSKVCCAPCTTRATRSRSRFPTQLIQHFGDKVYRTVIPRNVRLAEAPSHGLPVMRFDKTSKGAQAYLALAGEMLKRYEQTATGGGIVKVKGLGRGLDALLGGDRGGARAAAGRHAGGADRSTEAGQLPTALATCTMRRCSSWPNRSRPRA